MLLLSAVVDARGEGVGPFINPMGQAWIPGELSIAARRPVRSGTLFAPQDDVLASNSVADMMKEAAIVGRALAVVLLRHPIPTFGPEVIRGRRGALFPEDSEVMEPIAARDGTAWPMLVLQGGEMLTVMQIQAPMPAPELAARAAAAYWWPQAAAAVGAHRVHLVIAPLGPPAPGVAGAVASARRVTRLAAILTAEAGPAAIGVLWSSSGTLFPAQSFVEHARQPSPMSVWVDMRPMSGVRRGEIGIVTRGLRSLVGRELRLEPTALVPSVVLAQRGLDVAAYLLTGGGEALRSGDTIGTSAEELMRIREADDPALGGSIYTLTVESAGGGRR